MGVMSNEFSALSGANAALLGALDTSAGSSNDDNNDDEALLSRPIPPKTRTRSPTTCLCSARKNQARRGAVFRIYDEAMMPLLLGTARRWRLMRPDNGVCDEERGRRVSRCSKFRPRSAPAVVLVLDENDVPVLLRRSMRPFRPTEMLTPYTLAPLHPEPAQILLLNEHPLPLIPLNSPNFPAPY
jgi:hypothetical protein